MTRPSRSRASRRAGIAFAAIALVVLAARSSAQPLGERVPGGADLLNSDRIEAAFGSYGIEVLSSDAGLRVSNLYSTHAGEATTRTFAVVVYPTEVDASFAAAHAAILDGASIGATLRADGWQVVKHNRYFGRIASSPRVERLMRLDGPAELALHVYALEIVKGDSRFSYATIAEVHHPEYLSRHGVISIYAPGWEGADSADLGALAEIVRIVTEQMR